MVRRIKAKLVPGLRDQGLSRNTIAMGYGMSKHSVIDVFDAADRLGVSYGGVEDKTDDEVYALLFPGRGAIESAHEQPDWARVHGELGRVGVTLKQFGASGRTAFDGEGFDELGHHAPSLAPVLVRVTGDDLLVRAVLYCFNVCWAGSAVFFRSEKRQ